VVVVGTAVVVVDETALRVDRVVVSSAPPDSARKPKNMKAATPKIRASITPKSR
jgi:hypothetical protein